MSYLKNQEFLGLLNLMSQKPSRMDDAYLVIRLPSMRQNLLMVILF